jgi:hypothetical protein
MDKTKKLRNDILLLSAVLIFALLAFLIFKITARPGSYVTVSIDGSVVAEYPLDKDTEALIECESGYNLLIIKEGEAYIAEASCPDGICSSHRPIKHSGRTIVCLPNKVVVAVRSDVESDDSVDAVS